MKKIYLFLIFIFTFSFTFAKPIFENSGVLNYVVDWDTFYINHQKIRIIWIDSPEIYYHQKIKSYKFYGCWDSVKKKVAIFFKNRTIKLYRDRLSKNIDKYKRPLRYVYIWLHYKWKIVYIPYWAVAVYLWWAKVYKWENFTYKKLYYKLEKMAKKAKRGMWSDKCKEEDNKIKF